MASPASVTEELRYALLAAQREGNRQLAAALAPHDVTPSQAEVILVLDSHGPTTLKGLGDLLVCETGSPSRLVDTLVKRGLVDRIENPMDRRYVLLQLTAEGRKLRPLIGDIEAEIDRRLREVLDDDLQRALVRGIVAFLADSNTGRAFRQRFGARGE